MKSIFKPYLKENKMIRKYLSITYLFLILLITQGSLAQKQSNDSIKLSKLYPSESTIIKYHNNWTQNHYKQRIKTFKKNPLNFGDIVFIGNSITEQGRDWNEKFGTKTIKNRGIAGDITDGVLKRLDEIIYYKPKAIFILIGINDLSNIHHQEENRPNLIYDKIIPSPKYVGKNLVKISRILNKNLPDTKIYIRTILPTRRLHLKDDIVLVNAIIKQNEKKGYYKVIDLYSVFVDTDGQMKKELTKDGVHLNGKGYENWVAYEAEIINALLK